MKELRSSLFPTENFIGTVPLYLYFLVLRILLANEYIPTLLGLDPLDYSGYLINNPYFKLTHADILYPVSLTLITYVIIVKLRLNILPSILLIAIADLLNNLLALNLINWSFFIDSFRFYIAVYNAFITLILFILLFAWSRFKIFNIITLGISFCFAEHFTFFVFETIPDLFNPEFVFNREGLQGMIIYYLSRTIDGVIGAVIFWLSFNKIKRKDHADHESNT